MANVDEIVGLCRHGIYRVDGPSRSFSPVDCSRCRMQNTKHLDRQLKHSLLTLCFRFTNMEWSRHGMKRTCSEANMASYEADLVDQEASDIAYSTLPARHPLFDNLRPLLDTPYSTLRPHIWQV